MLDRLKNFNAERMTTEELVELSAQARYLRAEFEVLNAQTPEWLDVQTRAIRVAISVRTQERLEAQLREARLAVESLQSREEKKAAAAARLAEIEKQLATR